ncbi:MAG: amidohydrolase family protein [Planctomycetota bacterium]
MVAIPLFLSGVALSGGTVHSMVSGAEPAVATVWIEDDRIRGIGAKLELPPGVRVIDVTGKHVLPGLIDALVNHDADHDRLYVAAGVTLVRDVGNDLSRILAERDSMRATGARERGPGPAIVCAGGVLDGVPPSTTSAVVLASVEEVDAKLPRLMDLEPDFLSAHLGLSVPVLARTIELAHKRGLKVWAPIVRGSNLNELIGLKLDGLYHLEGFLPAGSAWDRVTKEELAPFVEKAATARLMITPALGVFARRLVPPKDDPPELAFLGPFYERTWRGEATLRGSLVDEQYLLTGVAVIEKQGALLKALHVRGVTLVPGSASPNPWLFPGVALIDELELFARAGIPSEAVLRMATSGAALALGQEMKRGTIEQGKIADLVVVDADPRANLAHLRHPHAVVLRGRVLERADLDRLLDDLGARQKKIREAAGRPLAVADPELPIGDVLLRGTTESRAFGIRISAESFAVVQRPGGRRAYCGRVFTPGAASAPDRELTITQTLTPEGVVEEFHVAIRSGGLTITVDGVPNAGRISIERRVDGRFVHNIAVKDVLGVVDAGSVTAALVLGQRRTQGTFKALFFDDYEPAIGIWELRLDKDGTHLVKGHDGRNMKVAFEPNGAVREWAREQGNGVVETRGLSVQAPTGSGLPVPAAKPAASLATTEPPKQDGQ